MKRSRAHTEPSAPPADAERLGELDTPTLPGLPDKEYFRIGEAARIVGVKPYVLRYWESEFRRDIRPDRTRSNQRMYRRKDVQTFLEIKRLRYEEKLELPGARRRLRHGAPEEALPDLPGGDGPTGPLDALDGGDADEGAELLGSEEGGAAPGRWRPDDEDGLLPAGEEEAAAPLPPEQAERVRRGLEELLRIVDEDEKDE